MCIEVNLHGDKASDNGTGPNEARLPCLVSGDCNFQTVLLKNKQIKAQHEDGFKQ